MNSLALNSSSINGVVRGLVYATVAFACASAVSAVPVRVTKAEASVTSETTIRSDATYTHSTGRVDFAGIGNVYLTPQHTKASSAVVGGSANITAYVLRSIQATASLTTGVDIVAVVADFLGTADSSAGVTLVADATRIQKARADSGAEARVTVTPEPVVTRLHTSQVFCGVTVRCEPSFAISGGFQHDAYQDILATSELVADPLALRMSSAVLAVEANSYGLATLVQPGRSAAYSDGVVVVAEPAIRATLISYLDVSANVIAQGVLTKIGDATLDASADIGASALQKHQAAALPQAASNLVCTAQITQHGHSNLLGENAVTATAVRVLIGYASVVSDAVITPTGHLTTFASADIGASATDISATPDFYPRYGYADITSQADVVTDVLIDRRVVSVLDAACSVVAAALRSLGASALVEGAVVVYADTVSNPESIDPQDRTFIRPAEITEFVRQADITEFRR